MMWQVILVVVSIIDYTAGVCNVCQQNQAACINSTSFYLCFGDSEPDRSELYHCQRGFDCTDLNAICVQTSAQRPPSCGDTTLCGMCSASANYKFACLSRTTFRMCYGAIRPIGEIGDCPPGSVCYGGSSAVCVSEQSVDNVTCDVIDPGGIIAPTPPLSTSTLPTSTTTTESAEILQPTEMCTQYRTIGLYPTIPNDPLCKRYIYCYNSNGIRKGREYTCFPGTYFHIQQQGCVFNKPTYCL